jgi:acetyltransferase-like isoleucine patch superfamily enzyme
LRGVTIGKGAVVGANSVVVHDVPEYTVVAGVPARHIKMRGAGASPRMSARV